MPCRHHGAEGYDYPLYRSFQDYMKMVFDPDRSFGRQSTGPRSVKTIHGTGLSILTSMKGLPVGLKGDCIRQG